MHPSITGTHQQKMIAGRARVAEHRKQEMAKKLADPAYVPQITDAISKAEFFQMLSTRLRDPKIAPDRFYQLADMYAKLHFWYSANKGGQRSGVNKAAQPDEVQRRVLAAEGFANEQDG